MSTLANNSEAQNTMKSELEQMLGGLNNDYAYEHNYAYIVTVILSQVGMNRTQNNIEDQGALQQEISKGQTQFASMQQFMALLEGNTEWDSNNKEAYWPAGFTSNNQTQLNNFANAFGQFFSNTGSSNDDTSTTTKALTIDFTTTQQVGSYPKGTQIIIDPCANTVFAQPPGASSYTPLPGGGAFSTVLSNVRAYVTNVSSYVTGNDSLPAAGSTVPQYLASAMANLQTSIDGSPEAFENDAFVPPKTTGPNPILDPVAQFAGPINANPLISGAEELYSNFNDTKGVNGNPISQNILNVFTGQASASSSLWDDMAGMMADWMQNKMQNQSSSSGTSAPSGSIYIASNGIPADHQPWSYDPKSILSQLSNISNEIFSVPIWDFWFEQGAAGSDVQNHMVPLVQASGGYDFVGAISEAQDAQNDMTDPTGPGTGFAPYGQLGSVISQLQTLENQKNAYYASFHSISQTGLFNEAQSSISMGSSTYQSQTQQNAAEVQQDTSTLTSYDQIGQSIITAVNKSEQTIAGNLKSS